MNVSTNKYLLIPATILLFSAICYCQDITSDFDQALGMVPKEPKWPNGMMLYDVQDAANSFVSQHSSVSAVEFLQTKLEDPSSRKLALLGLAKLAPANKAAQSALYEVIYEKRRLQQAALTAIMYLDPSVARPMAETLLASPGSVKVRRPAVDMLIGLGDRDSLEMLKQMRPGEKDRIVRKGLGIAISELEYRLTEVPPAKQAEWALQEILCSRTLRDQDGPIPRDLQSHKFDAAKTLHMQGVKFSRYYLKYKLDHRDVLAALIIGNQKQAWVVERLKKYCREKGALGDAARVGLAKTGRNGGLRVLVDSLVTGLTSTVFNHVMSLLRLYGDEDSALFADALSLDQRFSEQERRSLTITHEVIQKRLASKQ